MTSYTLSWFNQFFSDLVKKTDIHLLVLLATTSDVFRQKLHFGAQVFELDPFTESQLKEHAKDNLGCNDEDAGKLAGESIDFTNGEPDLAYMVVESYQFGKFVLT